MSQVFRTPIQQEILYPKINLHDPVLLLGSCFSDNIGHKLIDHKFQAKSNPFGIIFNPVSIFNLLECTLKTHDFAEEKLINSGEKWVHYDFHSSFCGQEKEALTAEIKTALNQTNDFVKHSKYLILTFGTAYVYRLKLSREIVANCHKMPSSLFEKELLTIEQITSAFKDIHQLLPKDIKVILTVSPVRHIKDGFTNNFISKSTLRMACHQIESEFPNIHYFPSYEIMMDDLRDYRFYNSDMLHPSDVAIEYIWQQFSNAFFNEETKAFILRWEKLSKAINHRPFQKESNEYQQFLRKTIAKLEGINEVDVSKEIGLLREMVID
ncbi:GSCFA domain-containing protein [Flexithrix dorotheae]|uniref:GSCFA domain-containing protein n=1 Tax=Flexithrix dorotheae TaxID=70993 RepID=UPI000378CD35|nr:GSCFA domain-containing protein [Flexithrix dorotheae]